MPSPKAQHPSTQALAAAAATLGCEVAAIEAIAAVEAGPWGAFYGPKTANYAEGWPIMLLERHLFRRFTGGKFDLSNPGLSASAPGGYGSINAQPSRYRAALKLDREAATRATSFGLYQILGDNWRRAGATSLDDFFSRMARDVDAHLSAFVSFIASDPKLLAALRAKDWHEVAIRYNGKHQNGYDVKLAKAYDLIVAATAAPPAT